MEGRRVEEYVEERRKGESQVEGEEGESKTLLRSITHMQRIHGTHLGFFSLEGNL